jgi:hypothetical protein
MSKTYRLEGVDRAVQEGDLVVLYPRGGVLSNLKRVGSPRERLHRSFLPREDGGYAVEGRLVAHDPDGETVLELPNVAEKLGA